ncbi:hypothetical protein [Kordia sp.]|uniref:hypothetical protein n=1 Tax=Kordia sp. TaxID=1965332 RepID=UPI0025BCBFE5|nr:hypothetical protein [Kordia sp.]MCH2193227.1 hypothetical protein [Kordia sp.]
MKKILGFLLLIIGAYIAVTLFIKVPSTIEKLKDTSKIEAEDPNGYLLGIFIGGVLLLIIGMMAIYFGVQLIKKAKIEAAQAKANKVVNTDKKTTNLTEKK